MERLPETVPTDDELARLVRPAGWRSRFLDGTHFVLTRHVLLRLLGLVYLVAFVVAARQAVPLIGPRGLEPASLVIEQLVRMNDGSRWGAFAQLPTLLVFTGASAGALQAVAWAGVALSVLVLAGVTNAAVQLALWGLYLSIVQVGQTFYGFGWESQLLETGMLAVFLCPVRTWRPFASAPPVVVIWLYRWLIVRIMLGAGLIKLRGDPCWRDLTCLVYHYETQPNPSPVSLVLHAMPAWFHRLGVVVNHVVELGAPWFAFGPRRGRLIAGALFVAFQATLIVSGNLSFLNWLTIVPAVACFDDEALRRLVPARWQGRLPALAAVAPPTRPHLVVAVGYAVVVALLSFNPVVNLLSPGQAMNQSYDRLHLVGTYGAFGSVGKERHEVVVLGTSAARPTPDADWREYQFPCKPGDVTRRPCLVSPYHYRLDWQLWFAGFSPPSREPWLIHLVAKLLQGDRTVEPLIAVDPFPGEPPRYVRVDLYRYSFTRPLDGSGAWWRRERLGSYLPPLSRDDPRLLDFLASQGW